MKTYTHRDDVPIEYRWDLTGVFASSDAWEQEFQALQSSLSELQAFQGTLAQSGHALLVVLRQSDKISERLERLYFYALLHHDEDMTNGVAQGRVDRITQLYVNASSLLAYIEPEILALSPQTLSHFIENTPELVAYKHLLADVNRKRLHIRSTEIEAMLASTAEICHAPSTIYSTISTADLRLPLIQDETGSSVALTQGNYQTYIRSANRQVRKDTFEGIHGTFLKQRNTFASTLSAQVKAHLFTARQRNYVSCYEHGLARYNVPTSVYDTLIKTVQEYIAVHDRYLRLRKNMLKLDELHLYDIYAPISAEVSTSVTYPQACEIIVQALAPLGERYSDILQEAFSQRWIDVYETPGKHNGAYSSGVYGAHPYMLLNWQDNWKSMYTLAHELGHCLHFHLAHAHQPYQYSNYTVFVAEVASTLNEGLLTAYLLKHTTDRTIRLAILNQALEDMRSKLFRQALSADFELQIHSKAERGEALTADVFEELYKMLQQKYYGAEVVIDDLIRIEWALIPHLYYDFYVYQYATGISAASSLVRQILKEGDPAVQRYLAFLSSGSSDYSIELLKKAGVDMTTPAPIYQALQLFESYVEQMEALQMTGA